MRIRIEHVAPGAITSLVCCISILGCSLGYNRGEMNAALASAKPTYVSTELTVEQIEAMKPQLKLPVRIAIAPPVQAQRWRGSNSLGTWSPEEVAVLESWQEPLRAAGVASELLILPTALVKDCEVRDDTNCRLNAQRAAAARAHADALLIINLATATDEYLNPASALYLTIIGLWLVPASHRDALTVAEGALLDNRNEYLYVFARGEGESKSIRPAMYSDTAGVEISSRVEALRSFGRAFLEQARQLSVK